MSHMTDYRVTDYQGLTVHAFTKTYILFECSYNIPGAFKKLLKIQGFYTKIQKTVKRRAVMGEFLR